MKRYVPRAKREALQLREGQECYLFGNPEYVAKIVGVGPEQSEVKFRNGNRVFVCNSWITLMGEAECTVTAKPS